MQKRLSIAATVATIATLGTVAIAVASNDDGPTTDPTAASFSLTVVEGKFRECVSANGPHSELRLTLRGPITADDSRLTGVLETKVEILVNNATSYGTGRGTFAIRDPATREKKVEGRLFSVESPHGPHGFLVGKIQQPSGDEDNDEESRSSFLANFSANSTGEGMVDARAVRREVGEESAPGLLVVVVVAARLSDLADHEAVRPVRRLDAEQAALHLRLARGRIADRERPAPRSV